MSFVKRVSEIDVKNVEFSDLKKGVKGGMTSYINIKNVSNGKTERLILQLPKLFAPFGSNYFNPENKSFEEQMPKYNVSLALNEDVKGVKELKDFLKKLDKAVCKKALKNKDWKKQLDKGMDEKGLKYAYKPTVKPSTNEKYPDSLNPKVPVDWNNKTPALQLFSKNREKLELTFDNIEQLLPKLCEMKGIIQICSVWFVSKKFGVTIKLLQGMVYLREGLTGCALIGSDSEDSDEESEDEESEAEESEVEIDGSDVETDDELPRYSDC